MIRNLTLKSLAACAALAFAGCLGTNDDAAAERKSFTEQQHTFAREVGSAVAKSAGVATTPGWDYKEAAEFMEQIGCPKLVALFNDFNAPTTTGDLPASFKSLLSCFEIPAGADPEDARNAIQKKFEDFGGLLDCICGGAPGTLSSSLVLEGAAFDAAASRAFTSGFDASGSKALRSGFDASGSKAVSGGFDASKSKALSGGFKAD